MGMTQQQFSYLSEMGISLWQRKDAIKEDSKISPATCNSTPSPISLDQLIATQLFKDIIIHLGFNETDLDVKNDFLSIGFFTWWFGNNEVIHFENNVLKTPLLSEISNNSKTKMMLMQVFEHHNLYNVSE